MRRFSCKVSACRRGKCLTAHLRDCLLTAGFLCCFPHCQDASFHVISPNRPVRWSPRDLAPRRPDSAWTAFCLLSYSADTANLPCLVMHQLEETDSTVCVCDYDLSISILCKRDAIPRCAFLSEPSGTRNQNIYNKTM